MYRIRLFVSCSFPSSFVWSMQRLMCEASTQTAFLDEIALTVLPLINSLSLPDSLPPLKHDSNVPHSHCFTEKFHDNCTPPKAQDTPLLSIFLNKLMQKLIWILIPSSHSLINSGIIFFCLYFFPFYDLKSFKSFKTPLFSKWRLSWPPTLNSDGIMATIISCLVSLLSVSCFCSKKRKKISPVHIFPAEINVQADISRDLGNDFDLFNYLFIYFTFSK